ncbi:MAG: DegQ family serine endoprotease [Candidatus Binatus sp.]|uniref:DegQ family serine endoprotease n=1 Tax=Candidatus Binatus sp. TaxID=2811406 RepID=UPI002724A13F|nr:DegQ family serine endoprotease [Candidatus Binatus sp.]MDO8430896.1 DegQ family serine endoprotease [Candidatus Binatus sp.]
MLKRIAAVAGGVFIGLIIAFARVGAFPFWGGDDQSKTAPQTAQGSKNPQASAQAELPPPPLPAPPVPGASSSQSAQPKPEPNEKTGVITSFAPLVKRVMPTVVNVAVVQDVKVSGSPFGLGPNSPEGGDDGDDNNPGGGPGASGPPGMPGDPFDQLRRYFGQAPREQKQRGLGSGVIVSADGYILTNNHVVGNAEDIHVTLMDKREFTAKVIGKDPKTDLALIKIDTKDSLPVAMLGESNDTAVGDWVVAIGNPFGFSLSVTAGIVSAKGRNIGAGDYDDFIQTDASINPGNSGGPLFNTDGQVIGINTAIYSRTGSNNGIGFAIPVDMAKNVMDQLKAHGRVVRGWLGVEIQEVTADLAQSFGLAKPEGALVASTDKDGPAAKAGLERGDIVISFDGKAVHDEHELPALVATTPINKKVQVEVVRNGKHMTFDVTIGERKEPQVATAKAEEPGGNWGMQVGDITPEIAQQLHIEANKGIVIRRVSPDSPAADAGLQPGDVVLEVNHDKVSTVAEFVNKAKEAKNTKKAALLLVQRGGATLYTVIKPGTGKG